VSDANNERDTYPCRLKAETGMAWLVDDGEDSDMPEIWLPKSQCEMRTRNPVMGGVVEIDVPTWLAEQKGLLG
jgi:hypothetical protein